MLYQFSNPKLDSFFGLSTDFREHLTEINRQDGLIHLLWNQNTTELHLIIDGIPHTLPPYHLLSITYFHKIVLPKQEGAATSFSFNREFYCIQDHDHEVSCNGILFFGSQEIPIVALDEEERRKFDVLFEVFLDEFKTQDNIQGEMLRMLLKRLIIKSTRLARKQLLSADLSTSRVDLVRKFNVLVDTHYREFRKVSDYANLLHKSPKTLSNIFLKHGFPSPLQSIHERIALEAKRLLLYTDKSSKEIAYDLGYADVSMFHKLFKKIVGQTPNEFKMAMKNQRMSA